MIDLLLENGADANLANSLGTTPLMLAAASGKRGRCENSAGPRSGCERQGIVSSANCPHVCGCTESRRGRPAPGRSRRGSERDVQNSSDQRGHRRRGWKFDSRAVPHRSHKETREAEGKVAGMGGMTALHYAAREGLMATVQALVESGVDVNKTNPVDKSTPLVIAISNGHYDVAKYLVDHGADPNLETIDGLAALYATVESRWAPVAWTPTAFTSASGITQQQTNYLDLMKLLLEHGANPNAKINKTLWFDPPHHNDSWAKAAGTTAFWRAAQATDLDAMKLLVAHGADPKIPSAEKTTPLAVAAGVGWNGNYSTNAPSSFMASVKYLVEEIRYQCECRRCLRIHRSDGRGLPG